MHIIKKNIKLAAIMILCFAKTSFCQKELDSLLHALNNKNLQLGFSVGGLTTTATPETIAANKKSAGPRKYFHIVSDDINVQQLATKYSSKIVSDKLFALLNDKDRDMYATALLYDLFDSDGLGKLLFTDREKWIASGRKNEDTRILEAYCRKDDGGNL
jgi:hypothetical protein